MKRFVLVLSALAVSISAFAQREYARELLEQDVTRSMNLHHNYEAPEKVVDTPAPRGYKPFYISHYGRHGSRYHWTVSHIDRGLSILDSLAAHDLLTEEGAAVREDLWQIKDAHKGVVGYLTHKGAEQHQRIAHRMYERCPQVFEQKDRQRVEAVSTAAQRCIQSMANFCLQLTRENPSLQFTMDAGERYAEYLSNSSGLRHVDKSRTNAILDSLITVELDPTRIMQSLYPEKADKRGERRVVSEAKVRSLVAAFFEGQVGLFQDVFQDSSAYQVFISFVFEISAHTRVVVGVVIGPEGINLVEGEMTVDVWVLDVEALAYAAGPEHVVDEYPRIMDIFFRSHFVLYPRSHYAGRVEFDGD